MLAVAVADQLAAVGGHNFNEAQEIGAVADAMADGGNLVAGLEGVFVPAGAGHAAGAGPSGDRAHRGGTHTWQRNSNIPTSHPKPVVFLSKIWLTF